MEEDAPFIKRPGQAARVHKESAKDPVEPIKVPGESIKVPTRSAKVSGDSLKVGRMNRLQVVTDLDFGVYLDGKNRGEILMPRKYVPEGVGVDDFVDAFVYLDSEDRLVATTEEPYAMEGELAFLKVVSTTGIGAFLDWGLMKDLLVPFREQREHMEEGRSYIVYIYYDTTSERLVASTKVYKFIGTKSDKYKIGEEVDLIICNKFDLGYRVIIDKEYLGVIYSTEIFQELGEGQVIKGYIKTLRADGKIDVELQKSGDQGRETLAGKILDDLRSAGGFLPLNDKTDPNEIYDAYKVSKRTFKQSIGGLYKKRLIMIEDKGIRLL